MEIDKVSELLGKIQSDITHIRGTTEVTKEEIKSVSEKVTYHDSAIKSAHKRLDDITPHVERSKRTTWALHAIIVSVATIFGAIGGAILKFMGGILH